MSKQRWFHAHKGPPFVCAGGAEDIEDIRPLAIIQDCVIVEAYHEPSICPYKPVNYRTYEIHGMNGKVSETVVLGPLSMATQDLADLMPENKFVILVSGEGFTVCHPVQHSIDFERPNVMNLVVMAVGTGDTQLDATRAAISYVQKYMRKS